MANADYEREVIRYLMYPGYDPESYNYRDQQPAMAYDTAKIVISIHQRIVNRTAIINAPHLAVERIKEVDQSVRACHDKALLKSHYSRRRLAR